MGNKNVVGSLVKKRARIMGKIRTLEKEADDLRVIADALGMSIKTFASTFRVNSVKPLGHTSSATCFSKIGKARDL